MPPKPKTLDSTRIVGLMRAGKTAQQITEALAAEGANVSKATVTRRMRELKGEVHAQRAADMGGELPDADAIPEGASLTQLDKWIGQAQLAIDQAQGEGDLTLMGTMLRVASALAETRRKATPVAPPDPNEHPDMVAAAKRARETLHKLVESAIE